jgi:hypothetical protein
MANFDAEALMGNGRNCQCESDGSDGQPIDSSSAGGGTASGCSRAITNGATASGGADSPIRAEPRAAPQDVCEAPEDCATTGGGGCATAATGSGAEIQGCLRDSVTASPTEAVAETSADVAAAAAPAAQETEVVHEGQVRTVQGNPALATIP